VEAVATNTTMLLAKECRPILHNKLAFLRHRTDRSGRRLGLQALDLEPTLVSAVYKLVPRLALAFQLKDSRPTRCILAPAPQSLNTHSM
jgi:hypothetical protein